VAAAKTEEASPASGARDRGRTSRLAAGAWRRVVAAAAARAARASLDAAERAIVAEGFGFSALLRRRLRTLDCPSGYAAKMPARLFVGAVVVERAQRRGVAMLGEGEEKAPAPEAKRVEGCRSFC
jgi:hypothetical protein